MKSDLKTVGRYTVAMISVGVGAVLAAIRFLASSAETTPADDALNSSVRGGLLNYRTGKFDDGTDPAGIYKPD